MVTLPEPGKEPKEHQLKKLQLQEIGKLETENRYLRLLKENFELKLQLEELKEKAQKVFPQVKPQVQPPEVKVAEVKEGEKVGDESPDRDKKPVKAKDNK
jgi:hypothetical protein